MSLSFNAITLTSDTTLSGAREYSGKLKQLEETEMLISSHSTTKKLVRKRNIFNVLIALYLIRNCPRIVRIRIQNKCE